MSGACTTPSSTASQSNTAWPAAAAIIRCSPSSQCRWGSALHRSTYRERLRREHGAQLARVRWYGHRDGGAPGQRLWVERKTHRERWTGQTSIKACCRLVQPCPLLYFGLSCSARRKLTPPGICRPACDVGQGSCSTRPLVTQGCIQNDMSPEPLSGCAQERAEIEQRHLTAFAAGRRDIPELAGDSKRALLLRSTQAFLTSTSQVCMRAGQADAPKKRMHVTPRCACTASEMLWRGAWCEE